jgi:hypothetical protein
VVQFAIKRVGAVLVVAVLTRGLLIVVQLARFVHEMFQEIWAATGGNRVDNGEPAA